MGKVNKHPDWQLKKKEMTEEELKKHKELCDRMDRASEIERKKHPEYKPTAY